LCNTAKSSWEVAQLPPCLLNKLDLPLHQFLKQHRFFVPAVQEFARVPFVIKQRISRDSFKLLFEGRFLSSDLSPTFRPFRQNRPTWHVVLDKEGQVEKCSKLRGSIPKSHTLPAGLREVSFGELAMGRERALCEGFASLESDPQSQPETVLLLAQWGLACYVNVDFCVATLPVSVPVCWIVAEVSESVPASKVVHLEAFTGQKNRIRFRKAVFRKERERRDESWTLESADKNGGTFMPDRASESNRASGMTVHLTGLSLALKLGLLSVFPGETGRQTFERLSSEMGLTFAYLWLQRDPLGRVRCVTYWDGLWEPPCSFEIGPGPLAPTEFKRWGPARIAEENRRREEQRWQNWKTAFDYLWYRRQICIAHKKKATRFLFDRWGSASEIGGGTHGRCFSSVRNCLAKTRVFCFSTDDSSLHSLKLFFARYCQEIRHLKNGVQLRTVTGTKILCLQTSEVDVENVSQFLNFSGGSVASRLVPGDADADAIIRASRDWRPDLGVPHCLYTRKITNGLDREGLSDECNMNLHLRGSLLVGRLAYTHLAFCSWLSQRFDLDLATSSFLTLSSLCFRVSMLDFWKKSGPAAQSLEKTKPVWEDSLRRLSKGGFSFSSRTSISSGEILLPDAEDGEGACSVAEFDLKSCYGYSLTNMCVPGAFGIGYTFYPAANISEPGLPHLCSLKRTDRFNRANSFEYLGVQAIIKSAQASLEAEILGVWSNFSPLGILYVGKFPVDLAIVFEGKGLYLFQMDGQWAHGCPGHRCPSLSRYASGASEEEVLKATEARDKFLQNWVKDNNYSARKLPAVYHVVNDCHHPEFGYRPLLQLEALKNLRQPYESLPKGFLSFPSDLVSVNDELTFILIGRGHIPENRRKGEMPLFVWRDEAGGRQSQTFGWNLEERDYLFTRDTFEHLVVTRGFEFSSVSACCFYKKCRVLPLVFGSLVAEREASSLAGNDTLAGFLKSVVNFTTGMFGLRGDSEQSAKRGPAKARIVSHVSPKYVECLDRVDIKLAGSVSGTDFYVCRRLAPARKSVKRAGRKPGQAKLEPCPPAVYKRRKATDAALPIYAAVVEFGKLRLLRCLEFLRRHVRPGAVRVLYSQVDNLVLGLSSDQLEDAVAPENRVKFELEKDEFFGGDPGKLVEKWKVSANGGGSWSFASARVCSYGLVSKDSEGNVQGGQTKMSGLSGISSQDAFESNRRLLAGLPGIGFLQERRTHILLNEETITKTIRQLPLPSLSF
jgi:hypothetical protein